MVTAPKMTDEKLNVWAVTGKTNGEIRTCNASSVSSKYDLTPVKMPAHSENKRVEEHRSEVEWFPELSEIEIG